MSADVGALYRAQAASEPVDARLICVLRSVLALSGMAIAWFDPTDPLHFAGFTYFALSVYAAYSVALGYSVFRGAGIVPVRWRPWIDVLVACLLVSLSQAAGSIFFHYFFFAILVASFTRGFREGFAITAAATAMFIAAEYFVPSSAEFELDRAVARPVYLMLLGFMMAYWGEQEILLRRRLWLLKEIGSQANPRFGADQTIIVNLRRLLSFFEADGAVLLWPRAASGEYKLFRVRAGRLDAAAPETLPDGTGNALLELAPAAAIAFNEGPSNAFILELFSREQKPANGLVVAQCRRIANLLETTRFVSAPCRQYQGPLGRLYIFGGKRPYLQQDADFLAQAVNQIAATLDNLVLLEDLMLNAAMLERSRISRDLHDTTVQPYIGLKIGLEALYRNLEPGSPTARQVGDLIAMSGTAIGDLRAYVTRLRGGSPGWPGENLLSSLRDQIERYRKYYGMEISLLANDRLQLTDRIAAEAYQIVCEGLSNIYRHTEAKKGYVELACDSDELRIEIGNENRRNGSALPFHPKSISERAEALGGSAITQIGNSAGFDVVRVRIPL